VALPRDSQSSAGFIDLHSHTNESDGTLTPEELVALARSIGLAALAITDHDTFSGYQKAAQYARDGGLDLICGIELNTRMTADATPGAHSVHLLAYFVSGQPADSFLTWLESERAERRSRNRRLAEKLQSDGVNVSLEEVEARGRSLAGRPHFARILVEKGYARNSNEAFRKYLGEEAPSFVPRESKTTEEAIGIVRAGGGIPVVAHPVRLGLPRTKERDLLVGYRQAGLIGLEIYHSEHPPELQAYYHQLAAELDLLPTGGSDFHGAIKPETQLGTGINGNVRVPAAFLQGLREAVAA
jgi:predicted metal-dependent phosphoesterase TrpH